MDYSKGDTPLTLRPNRLLLSPNLLINLWTECDFMGDSRLKLRVIEFEAQV